MSKVEASRRPKTGGRTKGTPNKATASIRDIARRYTDDAVMTLVDIMADESEPAAARVGAAKEILDRGYGKATTIVAGDDEGGPVKFQRIELVPLAGE